jgi:hypothetical protein
MATIASNRWIRTASVARITRRFRRPGTLSTTSLCCATDVDVQQLQAAKRRCERQVLKGRVSISVGMILGATALVAACRVTDGVYRSMLLIAAAVEIGLVPWYTSLACGRLQKIMALIDLDLEEGLVERRMGRAGTLLGVWTVLEDCTARSLRLVTGGRAALADLQPGALVTYRFAPRSRLVLAITPEESPIISPRGASRRKDDRNITDRKICRRAGLADSGFPCDFSVW